MESIKVLHILLVTVFSNNVLSVLAVQSNVPQTTISYDNQRSRRSSKEIKSKSNVQGLDVIPSDLKTTGQKWSSDEYHTFSSLLTSPKDVSDDNSPVTTKIDTYPTLTTDTPPFIIRGRYVRNPYADTPQGFRQEMDMINDRPQYMTSNNMKAVPKWNRFGQRHLKTYGPMIVETDASTDNGNVGAGYNNGYDSAVDYSTHDNNYYDAENYYKIHNNLGIDGVDSSGDSAVTGNGMAGWYNERPAHVKAQNPSSKISVNMQNLGILAAIKIGIAKIKVLAALKFLALIIIKLKAIAIVAFFLFVKFTVISKLFKFFFLPFLPNAFTWFRNAMQMQMNSAMNTMQSDPAGNNVVQFRNMSTVDPVNQRSTDTNHSYVSMAQFVAAVQSEKCLQKMACHAAGARTRIYQYVLMNWIVSSLINYIPNKKLKLYLSTFKDVSDYRLKNIFSNISTKEWLEWCKDRYSCKENA